MNILSLTGYLSSTVLAKISGEASIYPLNNHFASDTLTRGVAPAPTGTWVAPGPRPKLVDTPQPLFPIPMPVIIVLNLKPSRQWGLYQGDTKNTRRVDAERPAEGNAL